MRVLVTGGAGFIGSHTCVSLAESGHDVVIVDSFRNSSPRVIDRLRQLSPRPPMLENMDILDTSALSRVLKNAGIDAVAHFAALKSVSESVADPVRYYENNVSGTLSLLRAMEEAGIGRLVFSSSATVYSASATMPVREDGPIGPSTPYGRTKHISELMIADVCAVNPSFSAFILRYFNPVGAHGSGLIGEDPRGVPNNLMPYVAQVASGRRERVPVFGRDWPTRDGTGIRDYIHVTDLADAHVRAVERLQGNPSGSVVVNLGAGRGVSVLEVIRAFEVASGRDIPYEFVERRKGDAAEVWAEPALAKMALGWEAKLGLDRMCEDVWRWQQANPQGYD